MKELALISGVSREMGMGYEAAKQLGQLGYRVIISARQLDKADVLAKQLAAQGSEVTAKQLDVTQDASVRQLVDYIESEYGKLDVLINNAGGFYDGGGDVLQLDADHVHQVLDTNLLGAWRMTSSFAPLLQKSDNARVVNVSSGAGSYTDPAFGMLVQTEAPVYGISKLALNGLTVKLSQSLQQAGIKVNSVCPGWVATQPGGLEMGARPVVEGTKGIVWAATLPKDGPTGRFFRDGEVLGW